MKSIISFGVAVISSFLLICHFCNFVYCELEEFDSEEVQPKNRFLINDQRAVKVAKKDCEHHKTLCKSTGDPHITTFQGNYYHIHKEGVYTLVRLNSRSLWIQAKHVFCGKGKPTCNCGVMAREGNSIIGITKCDQTSPSLVQYNLKKEAPSGNIYRISGGWKIVLVSGIEIEVIMWEKGQYMHLYVKGLASEYKQYDGLCNVSAKYNSICNGKICEDYRTKKSENFFNIDLPKNLPPCGNSRIYPKCGCRGTYPNCTDPRGARLSSKAIKGCVKQQEEQQQQPCKRENVESGTDNVVSNPGQNLSVEDGRSRCNDALKLSPTYKLCSGRVDTSEMVEDCALDVDSMDDYGPAKSVPTEFETDCLDIIRISLENDRLSDISKQELTDLLAKVQKLVCPSQCSQNGKCVDSKCQCDAGFVGTDCSKKIGQPCQENDCSIGGICYSAEESCPLDATKVCNPAKCTTKWTSESSTNCDDGFENCT